MLVAAGLLGYSALPLAAAEPSGAAVRFDRDVKPILAHHCYKCHGRGRDKGGFRMDTRELLLRGGDSGPAVKPGDTAASRLLRIVSGNDPELSMPPPKDGGRPLAPDQVALLRRWIEQGLDWTDEKMERPYALALRTVNVPPGDGHPIDRLLAAYFAGQAWVPPARVDDARFARRLYLDLTGVPPTPAQLERFLRNDDPAKRERLATELLADPEAFVAQWMPFWMDHLRIGSSLAAGIFDNDLSAKPLRWLEEQVRAGAPVDQFVRNLIAGPGLDDYAQSIAPRAEVASAQGRPEMQVAQVVGQVFLGVRLQCASCHDSFVDRWTLRQAWGLASALGAESLELARCEIPTGERATPAFLFPQLGGIGETLPVAERRARLAELMTSPRNGLFARTMVNRVWARLFGSGLIEPRDEMVEHDAWHPDLLEWLAGEFVREGFDLRRLLSLIVTSRAYQLPAVGTPVGTVAAGFRGPALRRLSAEQFVDTLLHLGPAEPAPPRAWRRANDALMRSLGRPDRNTITTARPGEFGALHALEWMNGEQLEKLVQAGAAALVRGDRAATGELVGDACVRLLGRPPEAAEATRLAEIVGAPPTAESVADLLWVLIMLPEFHFIR